MLNSVGLQNPGVDAVIEEELPRLAKCFHKPVMANVSGFSEEEYVRVCEKFDAVEAVGWIEVNISCPNVHGGGMSFGTSSEAAGAITAAVRRVTKKPLILKLSPNVTDIVSIAKACEAAGADGLSLINTLMGMRIDMKRRRPVLAIRISIPVALRMVYQVYEAVKIPIVGMGGVASAQDVLEMMLGGRLGGRGGGRQSGESLCLPRYHRRFAAGNGKIRNSNFIGYHRRCTLNGTGCYCRLRFCRGIGNLCFS